MGEPMGEEEQSAGRAVAGLPPTKSHLVATYWRWRVETLPEIVTGADNLLRLVREVDPDIGSWSTEHGEQQSADVLVGRGGVGDWFAQYTRDFEVDAHHRTGYGPSLHSGGGQDVTVEDELMLRVGVQTRFAANSCSIAYSDRGGDRVEPPVVLRSVESATALLGACVRPWRADCGLVSALPVLHALLHAQEVDDYPLVGWLTYLRGVEPAETGLDPELVSSWEGGTLITLAANIDEVSPEQAIAVRAQLLSVGVLRPLKGRDLPEPA